MMRTIVTICFAFLTATGCMADAPTDTAASSQDDTTARLQEAVSSIQSTGSANNVSLLADPSSQAGQADGGAQTQLRCIVDGGCASCCHIDVCCSACGNGPVICTR